MLLECPKPTAEQLAKADEMDAEMAMQEKRKEDSFERCDTDGFLSQWASGLNASLARERAKLLRQGGFDLFWCLEEIETGEIVADKIFTFENSFNGCPTTVNRWRLPNDLAEKKGRKWIPVGERSRVQKQLGFREVQRWFPAFAMIGGGGKGLSGAASARVIVCKDREAMKAAA